ncbi:MAG TPA: SprB repeat-containing protein [Chitinophagaceae bacterium]|nr:SprB repeat-containing protein [Chitinophagaceae bacterium]
MTSIFPGIELVRKRKTLLLRSAVFAFVLLIANLFSVKISFGQSQTFGTPGTFTFSVPANVFSLTVECWGGGGAGGGTNGSASNASAGGGSGGAYTKGTISVTPNSTYTVVVGAGGVSSLTTPTAAGSSYFGNISTILAVGGANAINNTSSSDGNTAGASAVTSGNVNIGTSVTNIYGTAGGTGTNTGSGVGGTGGNGGNGGAGGTGINHSSGNPGNPPGGGGSGAETNISSNRTGSNGGDGMVKISWTVCPTITASAVKTDISCFNAGDGTITITGSGGSSPYMFSIDNGTNYNATVIGGASYVPINSTSGKFIGLPIGTYQIRVKDNNGCESKPVQ